MRKPKKLEKRVDVDLPITVSIDDKQIPQKLVSEGKVNNLSINGMKLSLPLPFGLIEEKDLDFDLDLPHPFSTIKGCGRVQWKKWDEKNNCIQCGLELEPMTLKQLTDLDSIVNELSNNE